MNCQPSVKKDFDLRFFVLVFSFVVFTRFLQIQLQQLTFRPANRFLPLQKLAFRGEDRKLPRCACGIFLVLFIPQESSFFRCSSLDCKFKNHKAMNNSGLDLNTFCSLSNSWGISASVHNFFDNIFYPHPLSTGFSQNKQMWTIFLNRKAGMWISFSKPLRRFV